MSRRRQLYEGRAKILYEGPEPGTIVQYFKDDAGEGNGQPDGIITGKGVLNNRISEHLMNRLMEMGIQTHFLRRLNMREQLVKEVEIIPLSIMVRNVAAGALSQRLGLPEGTLLPRSIVEFLTKTGDQSDPLVTEEHISAFGWAAPHELDEMVSAALRVNDFLSGLFFGIGIRLVDVRLTFGRHYDQDEMRVILANEISPDVCRLWDMRTSEKLDKDRYRQGLGGVEKAYQEVARRLGILPESGPGDLKGPVLMQ